MQKRVIKKEPNKLLTFIACMAISYFAAFIGGLFTGPAVKSAWYESIRPSFTPPNWIFPVVWGILFFFIGLALYFAWMSAFKAERKGVAAIFGINLLLNILWSALYFGMHNPLYAFFDIILIIISIIFMIIYLWGIDRKSSALLVPYLLWVSFAGALNYLSIH